MLGACNTGKSWPDGFGGRNTWEPFAQTLADILGVPVTAPQGFTWYDATKGLIGTSEVDPGPISSPGQWKTFYPNGH